MTDPSKLEKDTEDWVNLLAGKKTSDTNKTTQIEAEGLREIILNKNNDEVDELKTKRSKKALLQRLKKEGLLDDKKNDTFFIRFSFVAVAASIAVVSITIGTIVNLTAPIQEDLIARNETSVNEQVEQGRKEAEATGMANLDNTLSELIDLTNTDKQGEQLSQSEQDKLRLRAMARRLEAKRQKENKRKTAQSETKRLAEMEKAKQAKLKTVESKIKLSSIQNIEKELKDFNVKYTKQVDEKGTTIYITKDSLDKDFIKHLKSKFKFKDYKNNQLKYFSIKK